MLFIYSPVLRAGKKGFLRWSLIEWTVQDPDGSVDAGINILKYSTSFSVSFKIQCYRAKYVQTVL